MKTKKLNKVLTLKKSTVSDLNSIQMNAAKGGYLPMTAFDATCDTWCGCETNLYHCRTNLSFCCL